jgi:pimeloyl-ACP methyl ester carboxylesterase
MAAVPIPELPGVEHHFVEVRGARVHYAEAGSGPPLVLQHGWPQHWWAWRDLIAPLAESHRVICPDLRGLGWSEGTSGGYEKSALAADLIGLLDALEIDSAGLLGHDWGGFMGFLACFDHPDRISKFMALSIPHPWPPEGGLDPRRLLNAWYQVVIAAPIVGPLAVGRLGFPRAILQKARAVGRFSDHELEVYESTLRQTGSVRASVQIYRSFLLRELVPLARGEFRSKRLTVPTRLVIGDKDVIGQGVDDSYKRYADDMTLEWEPGASHFLPEERPEAVLARAREFFAA